MSKLKAIFRGILSTLFLISVVSCTSTGLRAGCGDGFIWLDESGCVSEDLIPEGSEDTGQNGNVPPVDETPEVPDIPQNEDPKKEICTDDTPETPNTGTCYDYLAQLIPQENFTFFLDVPKSKDPTAIAYMEKVVIFSLVEDSNKVMEQLLYTPFGFGEVKLASLTINDVSSAVLTGAEFKTKLSDQQLEDLAALLNAQGNGDSAQPFEVNNFSGYLIRLTNGNTFDLSCFTTKSAIVCGETNEFQQAYLTPMQSGEQLFGTDFYKQTFQKVGCGLAHTTMTPDGLEGQRAPNESEMMSSIVGDTYARIKAQKVNKFPAEVETGEDHDITDFAIDIKDVTNPNDMKYLLMTTAIFKFAPDDKMFLLYSNTLELTELLMEKLDDLM